MDRCGELQNITITGKNLKEIKRITVSDKELPFLSSDEIISVTIPEELIKTNQNFITAYFYDNEDRIVHLINVAINDKPIITNVSLIGSDINSLTFKVYGKNFSRQLTLYVDNQPIREGSIYSDDQNITYLPQRQQNYLSSGSPLLDRFQVLSCKEILYIHYPSTPERKKIDFLLESPSGYRSNTFSIEAP